MALYSYKKENTSMKKKIARYFSYISLTGGMIFLFWSFYPIIQFELMSRLFIDKKIYSPVPYSSIASSMEVANSVLGSYNISSTNLSDYTNVANWFPQRVQEKNAKIKLHEYTISIPKLNIERAKVTVGGEDLSKSLVHFLPETEPGEYGHVTIFGHSTLPQLYNKNDYKTIFTYLPELDRQDKIYVEVGDVKYEYEVYDMFVVNPDQVSVLDQKFDNSYLTLITCVPPGTYWKRLVVRAKLTKL